MKSRLASVQLIDTCNQVVNLPYLARDFYAVPDCKPDDGVLWLMIIRQNVTRLGLLTLLAGLEEGHHVNTPGIDIFPVTALKISVGSLFIKKIIKKWF